MTFIVFQDNMQGLTHIRAFDCSTLEEAIKNIKEGNSSYIKPSPFYMYFIYKEYKKDMPLHGTKYDVYKYCKAVSGRRLDTMYEDVGKDNQPNRHGLLYALTHNSSMAYLFTDDVFGDFTA